MMCNKIDFNHPAVHTYCNPIPLPDYPIGRSCLEDASKYRAVYRETADPSVIYEDGKWYLYPSCGMAYYTEDFLNWKHQRIDPYDCGYAPTIVKHKGRFYLTATCADLYVADHPLGPFVSLGKLLRPDGNPLYISDPMLFSDDDDSLYLYFGCGGTISGVQLDADNPVQLLTEPEVMFCYDTVNHEWERIGDWHEDPTYSWIEGSWMYKHNGTYYLTYCGPGTQWITYSMGAYRGKTPLGPWEYMETSPFITQTSGLVRGPGHGCIVAGPNGTHWAFYTVCMCYASGLERRIGMDPIGFDEEGNIVPTEATGIPQYLPGYRENPHLGNGAGLIPLTQMHSNTATSNAPGRDSIYAVDDSMISWWQPAPEDREPALTVALAEKGLDIASVRLIWRDVGLNPKAGIFPGPFGYRIEALGMDDEWVCVLDRSNNQVDMVVDYLPLTPMRAKKVRIVITKKPEKIEPGLVNFTVFGNRIAEPYQP